MSFVQHFFIFHYWLSFLIFILFVVASESFFLETNAVDPYALNGGGFCTSPSPELWLGIPGQPDDTPSNMSHHQMNSFLIPFPLNFDWIYLNFDIFY